MTYIYLLKSLKDGSFYAGITKDIKSRLVKHNRGGVKYTKGHKPYKIVWLDKVENYKEARRIEKWLKKRSIKEKESLCRGSSVGRAHD